MEFGEKVLSAPVMKYNDTSILIFCKAPVPGNVKTRLIPALGEERACRLHEALSKRIICEALEANLGEVILFCWPDISHEFFGSFNELGLVAQEGRNLGERMHNAFKKVLAKKKNAVERNGDALINAYINANASPEEGQEQAPPEICSS